MSEFGIYKVNEEIQTNKFNQLQHVERMKDFRLPICILKCEPITKRDVGISKKRWKDI
jgi:hypothetical protein